MVKRYRSAHKAASGRPACHNVGMDSGGLDAAADWEFRQLSLPRGTSRGAARRLLTQAAEYHGWELDRLRLFPDGSRHVVLRRRILRVARTL
jgi:hypothetical protein